MIQHSKIQVYSFLAQRLYHKTWIELTPKQKKFVQTTYAVVARDIKQYKR